MCKIDRNTFLGTDPSLKQPNIPKIMPFFVAPTLEIAKIVCPKWYLQFSALLFKVKIISKLDNILRDKFIF